MSFTATTIGRTAYNALVDDSGGGADGTVWAKSNVKDGLDAIDAIFSSASGLSSNGPLVERGRAVNLGEWTAATYAGGNFAGSGAMTWTVDSGDVVNVSYTLVGKTMVLNVYINGSSVGGVASTSLQMTIPGSFTAAHPTENFIRVYDNSSTAVAGIIRTTAGGSAVIINRLDDGNFSASSTNNTSVQGQITFEVS
jgi:hypothetical protein